LENKINKNKKNKKQKNSQNGPNTSLAKFQVVVYFGTVYGGVLERRQGGIERRHADLSVMQPAACMHSAWCSCAGALEHLGMD
jgi:hypothetical protein